MHPGIIVSGISSLFRKNEAPKPPGEPSVLSPGTTGLPSPNLSMYSMPSTLSETPSSPPPPPPPFTRPDVTDDPYFNPTFANDVRIQERSWWKNVVHFVKKHNQEGLIDAATNHIMSHMEFGGTMFDLNRLKTRYESVRRLEDVDDLKQSGFSHVPSQVRFIQYYTICNGFPKIPKEQETEHNAKSPLIEGNSGMSLSTPRISTEAPILDSKYEEHKEEIKPPSLSNSERSSLELLSPEPMLDEIREDLPPAIEDNTGEAKHMMDNKPDDDNQDSIHASGQGKSASTPDESLTENRVSTAELNDAVASLELDLPALPELPSKPDPPNLERYADKDARKLAEKEAKRVQKVYAQAVKDREKAIREREKIIEKRRKKLAQEAEKKAKEEKKRLKKEETAAAAAAATVATTTTTTTTTSLTIPAESEKSEAAPSTPTQEEQKQLSAPGNQAPSLEWRPVSQDLTLDGAAAKRDKGKVKDKEEKEEKRKERKFCNVAKSHGQVDPKWISVFMKDMDEVAAHTGLFFAGDHYEKLVCEVGNTIVEWVHADMTKRTILGMR
jgi:hypothetical protein